MAKDVLIMEVRHCGCGCQSTKLFIVRGEERKQVAAVSTALYVENKAVRDAVSTLAGALAKAAIERAGLTAGQPIVIRAEDLN